MAYEFESRQAYMNSESEAMMEYYIKEVLEGRRKSCDLPVLPFTELEDILVRLGCEKLHPSNFDQNGWQIDFTFEIERYTEWFEISGSVWYGNYKFRKL